VILGERIRLRRLERDDLPRCVVWLNDHDVRRHLALLYPMGLVHEERWFEQQLAAEPALQAFAIDARAESMVPDSVDPAWATVGVCGFHTVDWVSRQAELGLFIGNGDFRGSGFGTDVVRTLVRWAFRTLNLNRVQLRVYEDNAPAIRCYEKCGFRLEGRQRQSRFQDGRYLDTLLMAVLRDEWNG
jgi:RimJ/RimL family protein N-acetyltransferase